MTKPGLMREHSHILYYVLRVFDIVAILLAAKLAFSLYIIGYLNLTLSFYQYRDPIIFAAVLALIVFPMAGLYRTWRGESIFNEIRVISVALSIIFLTLIVISVITKTSAEYSRIWFGLWLVLSWILLISSHSASRAALRFMRSAKFNQRFIVIVGSGETATRVIKQIHDSPWAGFEIAGLFGKIEVPDTLKEKLPKVHSYDKLVRFACRSKIDQIWIAMPLSEESCIQQILHDLRHCTADIRYIPDIFGFRLLNHSISDVAGLPVLNLSVTPIDGVNRWVKVCEDWVLALFIVILVSPLMLIIALGVKMSSPGPVLHRQQRLGWNGRKFSMLKFRSMPEGSEAKTGPVWASKDENRATKFGAFLRKTSLDELPQFFNVLRGEMSIVGPRPERPEFVEKFKEEVPDYMKKHLVKAGITGWAQVNGWRGNTDLKKRIEYDLYYIENWSLWFDIKIILLTFWRGFIHENAY